MTEKELEVMAFHGLCVLLDTTPSVMRTVMNLDTFEGKRTREQFGQLKNLLKTVDERREG